MDPPHLVLLLLLLVAIGVLSLLLLRGSPGGGKVKLVQVIKEWNGDMVGDAACLLAPQPLILLVPSTELLVVIVID